MGYRPGGTVNEIPSTPEPTAARSRARGSRLAAPSRSALRARRPRGHSTLPWCHIRGIQRRLRRRIALAGGGRSTSSRRARGQRRPGRRRADPSPVFLRPQLRRIEVFRHHGTWVHPAPPRAWTWSWRPSQHRCLLADRVVRGPSVEVDGTFRPTNALEVMKGRSDRCSEGKIAISPWGCRSMKTSPVTAWLPQSSALKHPIRNGGERRCT